MSKQSLMIIVVVVIGSACGEEPVGETYWENNNNNNNNNGDDGDVTEGQPTSYSALAVGGYAQYWTSCSGGSVRTGYGAFLCPGGRIRGGGSLGNATELFCGDYDVTPPVYSDCTDDVRCYPIVNATVKSTLIVGGYADVDPYFEFEMLVAEWDDADTELMMRTRCDDDSSGWIALSRVEGDVGEDYCVSQACPAPGGSSDGAYGSCGTDCDCGVCWYCDRGECRYGGEGPYGCYRGCSG